MAAGDDPAPGGDPASSETDRDLLWLRGRTDRAPRRAEPLSLPRIVAAAVAELDEHGADRLTMRRLATRLGVTSTALYWHVSTKEDLLDLAVDHVLGDVAIPAVDVDPHAALHTLLSDWRATMLEHPWSPTLLGRPLLGPNSLARMESMQASLSRAGLRGAGLVTAARLLADVVIGAAVIDATWRRLDVSTVVPQARDHIADRAELYPTLHTSGFTDGTATDDELFSAGLDRLLDALVRPA